MLSQQPDADKNSRQVSVKDSVGLLTAATDESIVITKKLGLTEKNLIKKDELLGSSREFYLKDENVFVVETIVSKTNTESAIQVTAGKLVEPVSARPDAAKYIQSIIDKDSKNRFFVMNGVQGVYDRLDAVKITAPATK